MQKVFRGKLASQALKHPQKDRHADLRRFRIAY